MNKDIIRDALNAQADVHSKAAYQQSYSTNLRAAFKRATRGKLPTDLDALYDELEHEVSPLVQKAINEATKAETLRAEAAKLP